MQLLCSAVYFFHVALLIGFYGLFKAGGHCRLDQESQARQNDRARGQS